MLRYTSGVAVFPGEADGRPVVPLFVCVCLESVKPHDVSALNRLQST